MSTQTIGYLQETPLTSSWGGNYDLLRTKITDVEIISDFLIGSGNEFLDSSSFLTGTKEDLYDDVFPRGPPTFDFNAPGGWVSGGNGDTTNLDQCIVLLNTQPDGYVQTTAEGCYYTVKLDAKYEIYKTRIVFGTDWPGLTYNPGASNNMPSVTLPRYIEELYVEMNDDKTGSTVKWYGGSSSGNLPSSYSNNQLTYPSLTVDNFTNSDWIFPNFLDTDSELKLPLKDDWTAWESALPSNKNDAPITDEVTFYIGQKNKGRYNYISFALCELQIYGSLITDSPTYVPTENPVAPSGSPTLAPTTSPSTTPTAAPSASPTEDACPNFNIQQPCCASSGGYEFVNYTYNKLNDQIVDVADIDSTCLVSINNAQCCGNGTFFPANPVTIQGEIVCEQGGIEYTGVENVCNVNFLVDDSNSIYYGFEGVNGTNTEYANANFNAQTYDCSCDYVVNVCEVRTKLTCLGSSLPYTNDYDLCATQSGFDNVFVGGGETDIIIYANASLNDSSCLCNYVGDNCLDDVDKRDNFNERTKSDNDTCTVSFIRDCCLDSELSFGGVAISKLNLSTYLELDAVNSNAWGCMNGAAFCDGSDVPQFTDTKQSHFSWVYNEYGQNEGFAANSLCQCLIEYNNCTTSAPTEDTNAPSSNPSMMPSTNPTQSPTEYQYDEFIQAVANQPCCNGVNGTTFVNGSCADQLPLCEVDEFDGNSSLIEYVQNVINGSECTCSFNVGYWEWPISANPNYIRLDAGIWTKILPNITWQQPLNLRNANRRRLTDIDNVCYDFLVSKCDVTECVNSPFSSNSSYFLDNIGQTFEYWTDNALQIEHCHCYWLYDLCLTTSPTSNPTFIPTNVPTVNPVVTSSTTTKNPSPSPSELGDEQSGNDDSFVDDAVTLITDNYIYSGAAAVGLLCACCFLCILCINKRKQNNAEKTKEQMKVSADRKPDTKDAAYQEVTPETPKDGVNDTQIEMEQPLPIEKVTSSSVEQPIVASTPPPKMTDPEAPMIAAAVENEEEEEVDEELVGDDLYFVTFTQKPFGVTFGKNDNDKRNLFVNDIDSSAAGYEEGVILGSYIAKLEKEVVEGLGAKKIFKIFKNKYADKCPLKITFRKPLEEEIADVPNPPSPPQQYEEDENNGTPEPPAPPVPVENNEEEEAEAEYDENDEEYEYYDEEDYQE